MWNLTAFFKRRARFTALERRLLAELQAQLAPDASELLARQLQAINLVQRQSNQREVCCYAMKKGKPYKDPEIRFPLDALEITFASVKFTAPRLRYGGKAVFLLVDGYFFSLVFDRDPPQIEEEKEARIESIELHCDLMKAELPVLTKPEKAGRMQLSGWLSEWERRYDLKDIYEPLGEQDRNRLIAEMDARLPPDYREMLEQCEGFVMDGCSVLGLSQAYEIVLPDANYHVLAELQDRGVLAVRAQNRDGTVCLFEFEDNVPSRIYPSFREAVEKETGKPS